jgi:hypothetical protein
LTQVSRAKNFPLFQAISKMSLMSGDAIPS